MPSPDDRALRVQVLGPVRARCDGQELDLGPPQRRAILVALAMAAGRTVSRQDLIDRVWDNPTDKADSSLHTHISRLRKVLDPGRDHEILAGGRTGYVLRVGPGQVDALAFTAGVTAARREREAGDLASAAQSLAAALELWQGTALAGVEGQWAGTERVRLEEARLAAEEEHAAVQLALGRHCEVTPELAGLVRRHPLREELRCLLMLALYRSGRQADALAVFHDTRRVLDEELGIEPGPALRRLHGQVLAADPALLLTAQPGPAEPGPAEPGPAQSGSAQSGSAQPGPAQSGSAQSGSAQSGSAQSGSAQSGSAQSGSAQSGSAQPGPAQPVAGGGPARPADMAGVGAAGSLGLAGVAEVSSRPVPVPRELPSDVRAFTGREPEMAELDLLMPGEADAYGGAAGVRGTASAVVIAAVSGTAGVGKTALAVHWAHRCAASFPDGQLYVNLRGYDPGAPMVPADALARFLRALGVADSDIPSDEAERAARYRSLVAGKRLLVVLDNAARVDQVRPLLPGSAGVMVVVTSRDSLAGLVAVDGAHRLELGTLSDAEAVTLLRTLIGGRVDADPATAQTLAHQCALLPLALRVAAELAAARPDTPLAELAAELDSQPGPLELLDAGGDPYGAPATVFSWSYRHLPADAAAMFRLVGLHPGPDWDRYAAAALANTSLAEAGRLIAVLARAHLVAPVSRDRYAMHDLLRAYAADLAASDDGEEAHHAALTRLFDYYLTACVAAVDVLAPSFRGTPAPAAATPVPSLSGPAAALAWLDTELAALIAVISHGASHGWPVHTSRLSVTLVPYLNDRRNTEALTIHTLALDAAHRSGDRSAQAIALIGIGLAHRQQGRPMLAADCHQQALTLAGETGDLLQQARALGNLVMDLGFQGEYEQAAHYAEQAMGLFRQLGNRPGEAAALSNLGVVCLRQGHYPQAADYLRQAVTLGREIGHHVTEVMALTTLGELFNNQGDTDQAVDCLRQAQLLVREVGPPVNQAQVLTRLADVYCSRGQLGQAADYCQQALTIFREAGDREGETAALTVAGKTLLATGQPTQARTCYETALAVARQSGDRYAQATALEGLANACLATGEPGQAHGHWQQALDIYRSLGAPDASRLRASPPCPVAASVRLSPAFKPPARLWPG